VSFTPGIIGVGAMGLAVAERLLAAGFSVCGFRRGSLDAFRRVGGAALASPEAVAAASDPLVLLLPADAALAEVMAAIAPALRGGQIILCLGTHGIPAKLAAADMAEAAGAVLLDGEISGTPGMVRAGQASVLLAGDTEAAEAVAPVLAAFARTTTHCGAFGNAARMKLVTNYLVGVHTLAAADALMMARQLGLDPAAVVEAVAPSAGGSTMLAVRGRMMAQGSYAPGDMVSFVRFFDRIRAALAEAGGSPSALLDFTEGSYRQAIEEGFAESDIAAIFQALGGTR
jgi:putative dehydrogenase